MDLWSDVKHMQSVDAVALVVCCELVGTNRTFQLPGI
jgi:hypothetical protein